MIASQPAARNMTVDAIVLPSLIGYFADVERVAR
jgi:hypothetical protein